MNHVCFCADVQCQKYGCKQWRSVPNQNWDWGQSIPPSHYFTEKKPYKCPVCNGLGEWKLLSLEEALENNGNSVKLCKACDGKGIVWHP